MGSIGDNSSGGAYIYRSSKASLNAATRSIALDLRKDGIKVILLHSGLARTEMGRPDALIRVEQSVSRMINVVGGLTSEMSGSFLNYTG